MAYIINQSCGDFQQGGWLYTSQPVAFSGHPTTRGRLTGLRNKPQQKQTCQHLAVVYWQLVNLLMELSIDYENCSLTWCTKWRVLAKVTIKHY